MLGKVKPLWGEKPSFRSHYDAVIIGGGLHGLAAAYFLAQDHNIRNVAVIEKLEESGGFLAVTDKSSPEEIYALFAISKKAFKKSLGALYKQRKIVIQRSTQRSVWQ